MPDEPKSKPSTENPQTDSANSETVGYRNPPKKYQFQPGQSGNPKGRKKAEPVTDIRALVDEVVSETVRVTADGRDRHMSVLEATIENLRRQALQGDVKAALDFFGYAARCNMLKKLPPQSFVEFTIPGGDDGKIWRMYEANRAALSRHERDADGPWAKLSVVHP